MADRSNIEWCDSTFNPWIGCTKVSPACDHCYAERDFDHRRHVVTWGTGQARHRTSAANWKLPVRWNAQPYCECPGCGWRGEARDAQHIVGLLNILESWCPACSKAVVQPARRRVFCASLADVFDNEVPVEWRRDLFDLIAATPNLDWLLLTKRIGNAKTMMADALHLNPAANRGGLIFPLPNVWLGATICNQSEADRDTPKLLATPAAVRFISIELGLQCENWSDDVVMDPETGARECCRACDYTGIGNAIDWVICGGESGPHARPMHPAWARSLRDQCAAAGVPFLFKQWGEWGTIPGNGAHYPAGIAPDGSWVGAEDRFTEDCALMYRIGKKAAGRLLDGVEHNRFPEVQP